MLPTELIADNTYHLRSVFLVVSIKSVLNRRAKKLLVLYDSLMSR